MVVGEGHHNMRHCVKGLLGPLRTTALKYTFYNMMNSNEEKLDLGRCPRNTIEQYRPLREILQNSCHRNPRNQYGGVLHHAAVLQNTGLVPRFGDGIRKQM